MNGISTEMIGDLYWAGEDVEDEYGLSRHELLVALWFEATLGQPRFRRRWREWGEMASEALWRSGPDIDRVPLPPDREDSSGSGGT
jgi:hypothetical protein